MDELLSQQDIDYLIIKYKEGYTDQEIEDKINDAKIYLTQEDQKKLVLKGIPISVITEVQNYQDSNNPNNQTDSLTKEYTLLDNTKYKKNLEDVLRGQYEKDITDQEIEDKINRAKIFLSPKDEEYLKEKYERDGFSKEEIDKKIGDIYDKQSEKFDKDDNIFKVVKETFNDYIKEKTSDLVKLPNHILYKLKKNQFLPELIDKIKNSPLWKKIDKMIKEIEKFVKKFVKEFLKDGVNLNLEEIKNYIKNIIKNIVGYIVRTILFYKKSKYLKELKNDDYYNWNENLEITTDKTIRTGKA